MPRNTSTLEPAPLMRAVESFWIRIGPGHPTFVRRDSELPADHAAVLARPEHFAAVAGGEPAVTAARTALFEAANEADKARAIAKNTASPDDYVEMCAVAPIHIPGEADINVGDILPKSHPLVSRYPAAFERL